MRTSKCWCDDTPMVALARARRRPVREEHPQCSSSPHRSTPVRRNRFIDSCRQTGAHCRLAAKRAVHGASGSNHNIFWSACRPAFAKRPEGITARLRGVQVLLSDGFSANCMYGRNVRSWPRAVGQETQLGDQSDPPGQQSDRPLKVVLIRTLRRLAGAACHPRSRRRWASARGLSWSRTYSSSRSP